MVEKFLLLCALGISSAGAVTDIRGSRIPNWLTYSGLAFAIAARMSMGWSGLKEGLLGLLIGGGCFLLLFLLGGMGGGDVKMMAAVGAWAGSGYVVGIMLATAVSGGVIAVGYMIFGKQVRRTILNTLELLRHHLTAGLKPHPYLNIQDAGSIRVPFGVAIAIGTLVSVSNILWLR